MEKPFQLESRRPKSQPEILLELVDKLLYLDDAAAVVNLIEKAVPQIFGRLARLRLDIQNQPQGPHFPLTSQSGVLMGYVVGADLGEDPRFVQMFSNMTGWALSRVLPSQNGQAWSEWLRMARLVVEEGLPQTGIALGEWEIAGALRPAFHVGGDCFSYLANDGVLCFLLLDAVGHGLGSALLAASCRSLWRGVVYEKDLSLAISRLNERLFLDTGSDRFVAATMGYCLPDGTVEFVSCGQSPLFLMEAGRVTILPECDPPLGLFGDWKFQVQRIQVAAGCGLMAVTDGVLEWKTPSSGMFGEQRVVEALSVPLDRAETAIQVLLASLTDFAGGTPPPDDVCTLSIWRHLP